MSKYKAVFFDLDGTLLETVEDIIDALNTTFKEFNVDRFYSYQEGKGLLGAGSYTLVVRATKGLGYNDEETHKFYDVFFKHYFDYQVNHTHPFTGILEVLNELKEKGLKLFIVTNKPQAMTDIIVPKCFGDNMFIEAIGNSDRFKKKPDPEICDYLRNKYDLKHEEILFVGDSRFDYQTALNSKLDCALFTYGYEVYDDELLSKPKFILNNADDLRNLFK